MAQQAKSGARVRMTLTAVAQTIIVVGVQPADAGSQELVAGHWVNEGCVPTSYDLATGRVECVGSTVWAGTWTGVTAYTIEGTVDLLTGDATGTIDETFIGAAKDGSTGSLHLFDTFMLDGSTFAFHLDFRIIGGTSDFKGSRGGAGSTEP